MSNMCSYFREYNKIINEEDSLVKKDIKLIFSNNLADEFTQTMNDFTAVAAKMVNVLNVDQDLFNQFKNLQDKIKNLIEAAEANVQ